MNALVLKRKMKATLNKVEPSHQTESKQEKKHSTKVPFIAFPVALFAFALVFFCVVQLVSVSLLSPKGRELQNLNSQKEFILEENRKLQQEIAQMSSLTVVKARAEKELQMKQAEEVIYIEKSPIQASNLQ